MALTQSLWSMKDKQELSLSSVLSEKDLEDLLHKHIELLNSEWLVIGRQVRTENGKFLDLLAIERDGSLVVIELKKDMTPRDVTAQVIEYASYIAEKKVDEISEIYASFAENYLGITDSLDKAYYDKFGVEFEEGQVNQKVKMLIVAASMDDGTEHIIKFLRNTYQVDINILFFNVFQHGEDRIISRVWLEDDISPEEVVRESGEWNGEFYVSFGSGKREWEDAEKYGFISAGGGRWYSNTLRALHSGDRIWVNIPRTGYVGVGIVTGDMVRADLAEFDVDGEKRVMTDLTLKGNYFYHDNIENAEYIVPVNWIKTVSKNEAVKESGFFGNQNSVSRPTASKWDYTVERLKKLWNIT